MKLLFIVLGSPDKLEETLEGLIEAGVTGATVVDRASASIGFSISGRFPFSSRRPARADSPMSVPTMCEGSFTA